jgi:hypothetical protein
MRKTTIFRSNALAGTALGLVLAGGAVQAQEPPTAGQTSVHVVTAGETLWSIAQRYFGDPFLWPEIYRFNTMVVEDPHWIFPGEELRLGPAPVVQAPVPVTGEPGVPETPEAQQQQPPPVAPPPERPVEAPPMVTPEVAPPPVAPPPPPSEMTPTIFRRTERGGGVMEAEGLAYRPIRRGEFYASGFLTEDEALPFGLVVGVVGRANLRSLPQSNMATLYGQIEVAPPEGGSYLVNDSLLVVRLAQSVNGWGQVVVPTGIARVITADGPIMAEVVTLFERVADGHLVLPLEPFRDPGSVLPVPVQNGMSGQVLAVRDANPLPNQQDIVFVDLGRTDGVTLGDVFAMFKVATEGMAPSDTVAYLQVTHTRERSSSGLLTFIRDVGVAPGAPVRLVRKMP